MQIGNFVFSIIDIQDKCSLLRTAHTPTRRPSIRRWQRQSIGQIRLRLCKWCRVFAQFGLQEKIHGMLNPARVFVHGHSDEISRRVGFEVNPVQVAECMRCSK